MISKRTVPALSRYLLIVLMITALAVTSASAEGLFPSMNQMFGTAMPSVGVALGRTADETGENADGKFEVYNAFSYDDYAAFGAYLNGAGAVVESTERTDRAVKINLSARGASMEFTYDWSSQTATAVYPSGTRPETEKEAVEIKASILPPVGGVMPSAQFAVGRKPDREDKTDQGITQVWTNFTDADYSAFSAYLAQTGAALLASQAEAGVLTAEIGLNARSFILTYDWHTKTASVLYPAGTSPEREKWNALHGSGSILPRMDTIGKDLPSISRAISRLPDVTEKFADGSRQETYNGFEEADYNAFSQYLQAAGCAVDDYHVENKSVVVVQLSNLTGHFTFTYDALRHTGTAVYPKGSLVEASWTAPTEAPKPKATAAPQSATYLPESYCWGIAERYFKNLSWKNPSSVTIYSHSGTYDSDSHSYTFYIDYSAQNGFGGYNRSYYFITVSAVTGQITSAFGGS